MIYFSHWYFLVLLLLIPILIYLKIRKGGRFEQSITFCSLQPILALGGHDKWKNSTLFYLKMAGLALLIFALARPQKVNTEKVFSTEGIDIVLALDISTSMLAVDFKPNRLEAAKVVAKQFVAGRKNDRIGLVVFAGETFLQCPLTIDYNVLENFIDQVTTAEKEFDGTAIGMAIANSVNRLRDSKAKSKVLILLSDGRNNAGELDPLTAADLAKTFEIKIYTIGAGKEGEAPYPVQTIGGQTRYQMVDVQIDEKVLSEVASATGGKYFRATNQEMLSSIYDEISRMEKTEIKVTDYYNYFEMYFWFLLPGFFMIITVVILERTIWRKTP
ncbi:MAG: VWA domain-containing protein [Candidatus Marinimicrobia bacterium]|nr:VWA domain-containing protein [Candidatus Neomarinimicrobiota bacterium]